MKDGGLSQPSLKILTLLIDSRYNLLAIFSDVDEIVCVGKNRQIG